ncbi:MAG: hypothetical protein J6M59_10595 [Bacteroidaceae bacterium]|nr:hypothetical protein [Bacteroidaceae bacterium]
MIQIKRKNGASESIVFQCEINKGSVHKAELMKEDYIILKFSHNAVVDFRRGDYVNISGLGIFEIADLSYPSLNNSNGGYDYTLRMDRPWYKWKDKIMFYDRQYGREASWSLTRTIQEQASVFLSNLSALGITYGGLAYQFNFSYASGVKDISVAKLCSYNQTSILDALNMWCDSDHWNCEWWIDGNIIYIGKCELGEYEDMTYGTQIQSVSRSDSSKDYANRLICFGSTRNIPSTYRKELYFQPLERLTPSSAYQDAATLTNYFGHTEWIALRDSARTLKDSYFPESAKETDSAQSASLYIRSYIRHLRTQDENVDIGGTLTYNSIPLTKGTRYEMYTDGTISGSVRTTITAADVMQGSSLKKWMIGFDARIAQLVEKGIPYYIEGGTIYVALFAYTDKAKARGIVTLYDGSNREEKEVFVQDIALTTDEDYNATFAISPESFEFESGAYRYAQFRIEVEIPCYKASSMQFDATTALANNSIRCKTTIPTYLTTITFTAGEHQGQTFDAVVNAEKSYGYDAEPWIAIETDETFATDETFSIDNIIASKCPSSFFSYGNSNSVVEGVVQKRLALPVGVPYIDADNNVNDDNAIERVIINEDIYPHKEYEVDEVMTREYEDSEEDEHGNVTKKKWQAYQIKVGDLTNFSEDYLLDELHIVFSSGLLNGMDFALTLIRSNDEYTLLEIVRNEDYVLKLPNDIMKPTEGDTFTMYGYDTSFMSDNLVGEAEQRLLQWGQEQALEYQKDKNSYSCKMNPVWLKSNRADWGIGKAVNLVTPYTPNGRHSRIYSFEKALDFSYDCTYTVSESANYSRLAELQGSIDSIVMNPQMTEGKGCGGSTYVIKEFDSTEWSDTNVLSSKRSRHELLSKNNDDEAKGIITFLAGLRYTGKNGVFIGKDGAVTTTTDIVKALKRIVADNIESDDFTGGQLGSGFCIRNENGQSYMEVDRLLVRMKAIFTELEINKLSYAGGNVIFSCAGEQITAVEEYETYYRCYFTTEDGDGNSKENMFAVGDLVRCQNFNLASTGTTYNAQNKYYWRKVIGKGSSYIDLSKADCDSGSDIPEEGDSIVQLGNTQTASRQNAIMLQVDGELAPAILQYAGIDSYSLSGKVVTQISPYGNVFKGSFSVEDRRQDGTVSYTGLAEYNAAMYKSLYMQDWVDGQGNRHSSVSAIEQKADNINLSVRDAANGNPNLLKNASLLGFSGFLANGALAFPDWGEYHADYVAPGQSGTWEHDMGVGLGSWDYYGHQTAYYHGEENLNSKMTYCEWLCQEITDKLEPDTWYTFSFMLSGTANCDALQTWIYPNVCSEYTVDDSETVTSMSDVAARWTTEGWRRHIIKFKTRTLLDTSVPIKLLFRVEPHSSSEFFIYVSQVKLEKGEEYTAWNDGNLPKKLLATGIDIQKGLINMSADNFMLHNSRGERNLYADAYGNLKVRGDVSANSFAAKEGDLEIALTGRQFQFKHNEDLKAYFQLEHDENWGDTLMLYVKNYDGDGNEQWYNMNFNYWNNVSYNEVIARTMLVADNVTGLGSLNLSGGGAIQLAKPSGLSVFGLNLWNCNYSDASEYSYFQQAYLTKFWKMTYGSGTNNDYPFYPGRTVRLFNAAGAFMTYENDEIDIGSLDEGCVVYDPQTVWIDTSRHTARSLSGELYVYGIIEINIASWDDIVRYCIDHEENLAGMTDAEFAEYMNGNQEEIRERLTDILGGNGDTQSTLMPNFTYIKNGVRRNFLDIQSYNYYCGGMI